MILDIELVAGETRLLIEWDSFFQLCHIGSFSSLSNYIFQNLYTTASVRIMTWWNQVTPFEKVPASYRSIRIWYHSMVEINDTNTQNENIKYYSYGYRNKTCKLWDYSRALEARFYLDTVNWLQQKTRSCCLYVQGSLVNWTEKPRIWRF